MGGFLGLQILEILLWVVKLQIFCWGNVQPYLGKTYFEYVSNGLVQPPTRMVLCGICVVN